MHHPDSLVTVRLFDDPVQAHLARCLLENAGLQAFVHDEHIVTLNRLFSHAVGGVKLKVPAADERVALEVLAEVDERPFTNADDQPLACPQCHGKRLSRGPAMQGNARGWAHMAVAFLFMAYPLALSHRYKCEDCGHTFRQA